ncbi:alpha/beta hydrolase [Fulvivirga lutimaris]|uniref:alpha/beta hydrolase n=1 Tax=Fulvivirga lutimaris TaxID=1819566 RepID=UPI0012BD81EA|nr:alpha/beta hydrolase [Fulvivirga lutimaris]MTI41671.1 alpha/beta hydrolase [Fulvivirga lutimaris]
MRCSLNFLFILIHFNISAQHNITFGERNPHAIKIYMDKNGDIYPDYYISSEKLKSADFSLMQYFELYEADFIKAAAMEGLEIGSYTENNYKEFKDYLFKKKVDEVNSTDPNQPLYILIHGFRKGYADATSDFAKVAHNINELQGENSAKFVEVYWDGLFHQPYGFLKFKRNANLFKLYENEALMNATRVGYGLRNILPEIVRDEYSIITHSLGSQVLLSALTNTYEYRSDLVNKRLLTPAQPIIKIAMLAPAVNNEPFKDYYNRNTTFDFEEKDNYYLTVFYNENDFVLKKKLYGFGPGSTKHGNTSLGCNCNDEAIKLQEYFQKHFTSSYLKVIDTGLGSTHLYYQYSNSEPFQVYINNEAKTLGCD